jgi:hypothetical protein
MATIDATSIEKQTTRAYIIAVVWAIVSSPGAVMSEVSVGNIKITNVDLSVISAILFLASIQTVSSAVITLLHTNSAEILESVTNGIKAEEGSRVVVDPSLSWASKILEGLQIAEHRWSIGALMFHVVPPLVLQLMVTFFTFNQTWALLSTAFK